MFLSPDSARRDPKEFRYPGDCLSSGWIRVIRLLPGDWATPIQCELFTCHLSLARYKALSYVWGSKHRTRPIRLADVEFPVTVNLESALRHLRELYKTVEGGPVLWVDSLCINQADDVERSSQVRMMGDIYARCEQVIVYLGDHTKSYSDPQHYPHSSSGKATKMLPVRPRKT